MKKNLFIRQLGEYFETFLPDVSGLSEKTIKSYEDSFDIFFQFMLEELNTEHHHVTYKQLNPVTFDRYLIWLKNKRNYSDASVRQRMSAINSFLKYASRREMSALNAYSASTGTTLPTVHRTEFPYFTIEETKIILGLPKHDVYLGSRDLVVLSFLYETAARAQELCKVRVCDVRFGSPTKVRLHGKWDKVREIPISDDVAALLRYHLKNNGINNRESKSLPLFTSQTNEEMTTACVRSIVAKYVNKAKSDNPSLFREKNYSPHCFRHSKAVHMAESGIDIIYIRNFLGHENISTTEIYARIGQAVVTKALTERKIPVLSAPVPQADKPKRSRPRFFRDRN